MKYTVTSGTDVGLVRHNNEDSLLIDETLNLFVVADGMGGYQKGEVASQITCRSIQKHLQDLVREGAVISKSDFLESVRDANRAIRKKIDETANLDRMGSTVVSLLMRPDCLLIVNVGDSRAYRFRNKRLEQISVDHSLIQETRAAGIKKELAPQFKNIVTRAMGMKDVVVPDVYAETAEEGDIFLLCSDGLHGFVEDPRIAEILGFGGDLEAQVRALIQAAKDGGGKDNITCILIRIEELSSEFSEPLSETYQIPLYRLQAPDEPLLRPIHWKILLVVFLFVLLCVLGVVFR